MSGGLIRGNLDHIVGNDLFDIQEALHDALHLGHAEEVFHSDSSAEIRRGLDILGGHIGDFFDGFDNQADVAKFSSGKGEWLGGGRDQKT